MYLYTRQFKKTCECLIKWVWNVHFVHEGTGAQRTCSHIQQVVELQPNPSRSCMFVKVRRMRPERWLVVKSTAALAEDMGWVSSTHVRDPQTQICWNARRQRLASDSCRNCPALQASTAGNAKFCLVVMVVFSILQSSWSSFISGHNGVTEIGC